MPINWIISSIFFAGTAPFNLRLKIEPTRLVKD